MSIVPIATNIIHNNFNSMFEILSYSFFQKALISGILVSLISWILGSLVVLRREPNVTHSISNILFLWIVISFFFSGNYYIFGIISAIFWAFIIHALEEFTSISKESSKEILSQVWLAAGVFCIGLLGNIQIDIFNFLFGNILFVQAFDIYLLLAIWISGILLWCIFWKRMTRVILSPEIAKSQGIPVSLYNLWYLIYLALFIAFSIKIFWVLLLWAFLVIPGNIGKVLAKSLQGVYFIATISSLFAVIFGLFASYFFDTSAGASIVLILGIIFFLANINKAFL